MVFFLTKTLLISIRVAYETGYSGLLMFAFALFTLQWGPRLRGRCARRRPPAGAVGQQLVYELPVRLAHEQLHQSGAEHLRTAGDGELRCAQQ